MNIPELSKKLNMPTPDVTYYVMTFLKYGFIATGEIDDMDEYFNYKIKE